MNHQEENWTIMVYMGADSILDNFAIESLKQMKRAAGDGVTVAVQFDASGYDEIRRLIFDGTGDPGASIENNVVDRFLPDNSKAPADFLEDFIVWAYSRPDCQTKHYCLVLWTDGSLSTEIPTEKEPQRVIDKKRRQDFLLPVELGLALKRVRGRTGRDKFDIIGMDACNMSMVEDTYELSDCAEFLIASEEEIPDASWPYERLLPLFRDHKDNPMAICKMVAREYKRAYQDYIFDKFTGLKEVTLSCLHLARISSVTGPLDKLALALLSAVPYDGSVRSAIIFARKKSKAFVVGLFVDVYDFCYHLRKELTDRNMLNTQLMSACTKVCNAISNLDEGTRIVVENQTFAPTRCHGLSVFFPDLNESEKEEINRVKASKGGTDILNKSRSEGIGQIESYYATLQLAKDTHWDEFIAFGWSRCLIKETPLELDMRYSAQQCAIHVERYLSQLEQDCQDCKVKSAVA